MTEPISFQSQTANLSLPLLFTGQAQKEFTLNQALSSIDALLPRVVTGSFNSPPADAQEGQCFRVTGQAEGAWSGSEEMIALFLGGGWQFITPWEGMQIFEQSDQQFMIYKSRWIKAASLPAVEGGAVIDQELRAAFASLILELGKIGIFREST
ncbi:MAG: DUF2793 domain-containing protein [Pseudomonadota bacterium]|nr:DUF2793 domain-containing protein [Pseudomonadota bacterium]